MRKCSVFVNNHKYCTVAISIWSWQHDATIHKNSKWAKNKKILQTTYQIFIIPKRPIIDYKISYFIIYAWGAHQHVSISFVKKRHTTIFQNHRWGSISMTSSLHNLNKSSYWEKKKKETSLLRPSHSKYLPLIGITCVLKSLIDIRTGYLFLIFPILLKHISAPNTTISVLLFCPLYLGLICLY